MLEYLMSRCLVAAGKKHIFVEVSDAVDFCREAMTGGHPFLSVSQQLEGQEALRRALSTPVQPFLRSAINAYHPPLPV